MEFVYNINVKCRCSDVTGAGSKRHARSMHAQIYPFWHEHIKWVSCQSPPYQIRYSLQFSRIVIKSKSFAADRAEHGRKINIFEVGVQLCNFGTNWKFYTCFKVLVSYIRSDILPYGCVRPHLRRKIDILRRTIIDKKNLIQSYIEKFGSY